MAHLVGPVTSNAADALATARQDLPPVRDHVGGSAGGVGGRAGRPGVRADRGRPVAADPPAARRHGPGVPGPGRGLQGSADRAAELLVLVRAQPVPPARRQVRGCGQGKNWERKIARAQFLGRAPHDATWLLWGIIGAQLVMAVCVWQLHVQPPVVIRNLGVAIAGLVLPALMAFLYSAWSDPTKRRTIGVLWDVGTFWPRSYHPLSPPCYTERAVPELQRRMWWLHDNGGRVMLIAHSQGAVLATAALVQPGCRPEGDHPALITFGSPVCKLYSWGFPAYFDQELLEPAGARRGRAAERLAQLLLPDRPHRRAGGPGPVRGRRRPGGHRVPRPGRVLLRLRAATALGPGPLRLLGRPPRLEPDQPRRRRACGRAAVTPAGTHSGARSRRASGRPGPRRRGGRGTGGRRGDGRLRRRPRGSP